MGRLIPAYFNWSGGKDSTLALYKVLQEKQFDIRYLLTTFNEIDLTAISEIRARHKDRFEKEHGVKLGFMSFFVKACVQALKELPGVNAEIDGTDIIYKNFYDIGVAVGTEKGLVVPVLRDAEDLGLAGVGVWGGETLGF